MNMANTIILTVDVEDWFQVENLRQAYPLKRWDSCAQKVQMNTRILLELFDHYDVQATFFVLGWTGERHPDLVREIHSRGHEIASHGYAHSLCPFLSETELKEDFHRSKALLEDITGAPVKGYRAPAFSISDRVMDLLQEEGYRYDSSWNRAAVSSRYGQLQLIHKDPDNGHYVSNSGLMELPISNLQFKSLTIPWGGGGYFRFWPSSLFMWGVNRIIKNHGFYLFYFHPWELDSVQPHVRQISPLSRFRHYRNLELTFHRMNLFLSSFQGLRFTGCNEYLQGPSCPTSDVRA
jgi:polysaccharide deacetylase family protein (PEP-CTERM system associated)